MIEFNTVEFRNAYGKEPKGFGSWAFSLERNCGLDGVMWVNQSTYGNAKKEIKRRIREQMPSLKSIPVVTVYVLS